MLVISDLHVKELLSTEHCMDAVRDCLKAVSNGDSIQPMRQMFRLPNVAGILGWMPGCVEQAGDSALGVKLMSVVPAAEQRMVHNGIVVLFDEPSGRVLAIVEAGSLTAIRTPAASAVATDLLARPDAKCLALLGTGHQAQGHLHSLTRVRDFDQVKVWSPSAANAKAFAAQAASRYGIPATAYNTVQETVAAADVICTATAAPEPILKFEWVAPGAHINAIGSSVPSTAEIDSATVAQTRFFVDHRETVKAQGGEFRRALEEGVIAEDHIRAEIGEILLGKHPGRCSDREITLYKSVGIVAYDLAAAQAVYRAAKATGLRVDVELNHRVN